MIGAVSIGAEFDGPGVIGPGVHGAELIGADVVAPPPGTITTTPESWGTAWVVAGFGRVVTVWRKPPLAEIRSLLDTAVPESTTGMDPRCTVEQPLSKANVVIAGINHLFT